MALTAQQRAAGRVFRDRCQAELDNLNAAEPAGGPADPVLRVIRHPCPERDGASHGIVLREHYQAAGPVCFIWKQGRCPECGLLLRSVRGIVDLTADRLPERERVA